MSSLRFILMPPPPRNIDIVLSHLANEAPVKKISPLLVHRIIMSAGILITLLGKNSYACLKKITVSVLVCTVLYSCNCLKGRRIVSLSQGIRCPCPFVSPWGWSPPITQNKFPQGACLIHTWTFSCRWDWF